MDQIESSEELKKFWLQFYSVNRAFSQMINFTFKSEFSIAQSQRAIDISFKYYMEEIVPYLEQMEELDPIKDRNKKFRQITDLVPNIYSFLNDQYCGSYRKENLDYRDNPLIKSGLQKVIDKLYFHSDIRVNILLDYVCDQMFRIQKRPDKDEDMRFYLNILMNFLSNIDKLNASSYKLLLEKIKNLEDYNTGKSISQETYKHLQM